jgi:hypothetical protein
MPILGAHQSIAGGYHKAVELGVEAGCQVIQVFTKMLPNRKSQVATRSGPAEGRS